MTITSVSLTTEKCSTWMLTFCGDLKFDIVVSTRKCSGGFEMTDYAINSFFRRFLVSRNLAGMRVLASSVANLKLRVVAAGHRLGACPNSLK